MRKQHLLITVVLTLLTANQLKAGWIITKNSYDSDQGAETALAETIYIQDNIMKVVRPDVVTVFNLNTEKMTLMSPAKKTYWTGNIEDYKKEIISAMKSAMAEQLKNASQEQQEMIKKMYHGMIESIENPSKFAGEEPEEYDLQIEKTEEKDKIAGHTAFKYQVIVNGILKEEAWLSESNRAHSEFDIGKFYSVFGEFTNQLEADAFYKQDTNYIDFQKKGFPLKSIRYFGGYESIEEVIKLERENIEKQEFDPPGDYKKVSLVEIGLNEQE